MDFYRGRHSWRKLDNFVDKLQRIPTSWLVWAMQNDVERMRDLSHAGLLDRGGEWKPETFQYGTVEQLLAALLVTVQSAVRGEGDPRPTPIVPRTARVVLDEEANVAAVAAIDAVMVEVSDEDYRAWVAGAPLPD